MALKDKEWNETGREREGERESAQKKKQEEKAGIISKVNETASFNFF